MESPFFPSSPFLMDEDIFGPMEVTLAAEDLFSSSPYFPPAARDTTELPEDWIAPSPTQPKTRWFSNVSAPNKPNDLYREFNFTDKTNPPEGHFIVGRDSQFSKWNEKKRETEVMTVKNFTLCRYDERTKCEGHDPCQTIDTLIYSTPAAQRTFYEYVSKSARPFFDVDCQLKDCPSPEHYQEALNDPSLIFEPVSTAIVRFFTKTFGEPPALSIYSSCTPSKISYHILIENAYFENFATEAMAFYEGLMVGSGLPDEELWVLKCVDKAIYSQFRALRIVGCRKLGKDNEKKCITHNSHVGTVPHLATRLGTAKKLDASKLPITDPLRKVRISIPMQPFDNYPPPCMLSESFFEKAKKFFNKDAPATDATFDSYDDPLSRLVFRVPNGGVGQPYDVQRFLMYCCHAWGVANNALTYAENVWLKWCNQKNHPDSTKYSSDWRSFANSGNVYKACDLDYLGRFVTEIFRNHPQKKPAGPPAEQTAIKKGKTEETPPPTPQREPLQTLPFDDFEEDFVLQDEPPSPPPEAAYEDEEDVQPTVEDISDREIGKFFEDRTIARPFVVKDFETLPFQTQNGLIILNRENIDLIVDFINSNQAYITSSQGYLVKGLDKFRKVSYTFSKTLVGGDFFLQFIVIPATGTPKSESIQVKDLLKGVALKRRLMYHCEIFAPGLSETYCTAKRIFNLFRGYPLLQLTVQPNTIKHAYPVFNHLYHRISASSQRVKAPFDFVFVSPVFPHEKKRIFRGEEINEQDLKFWHILCWFAWLFQKPKQKIQFMYIFLGVPGAGKGALLSFLNNLFGDYFSKLAGPSRIGAQFNSFYYGRTVFCFDEFHHTSNRVNTSTLTRQMITLDPTLLDLITEHTMVLEQKYRDPATVQNTTTFCAATQETVGLHIPVGDRRLQPTFLDDTWGGVDHFDKFFKAIENQQICAAFAQFCRDVVDLENFDHKRPINTTDRKKLIKNSQLEIVQFFQQWVGLFCDENADTTTSWHDADPPLVCHRKTKKKGKERDQLRYENEHIVAPLPVVRVDEDHRGSFVAISMEKFPRYVPLHKTMKRLINEADPLALTRVIATSLRLNYDFYSIHVPKEWYQYARSRNIH